MTETNSGASVRRIPPDCRFKEAPLCLPSHEIFCSLQVTHVAALVSHRIRLCGARKLKAVIGRPGPPAMIASSIGRAFTSAAGPAGQRRVAHKLRLSRQSESSAAVFRTNT